jgi:serine/threonine protein kinase
VASRKSKKRVWIPFGDLETYAITKAKAAAEAAQLAQCSHCALRKFESFEAIKHNGLEESMHALSSSVTPWKADRFQFVRKLQDAPRNHGCVAEMIREDDGLAVAVKRMPNWWVQSGQDDFKHKHPREVEQPWRDAGLVKELQDHDFPHVCNLVGIFCDQQMTYMVSCLATEGDLFSWAQLQPAHSEAREPALRPIVGQLLDAVRWLHELDVAHGDLSLENILITKASGCTKLQVKLIDFGMATLGRKRTPGSDLGGTNNIGKDTYRAPEVIPFYEHDGFLADVFSLGVSLYAMFLLDYPWKTTASGKSDEFDLVRRIGAETFLKKKAKVRGQPLTDLISAGLIGLMAGMLAPQPDKRFCLGETCLLKEGRVCAWKSPWLAVLDEQTSGPASDEPVAWTRQCSPNCMSSNSVSTMAPDSDSDSAV